MSRFKIGLSVMALLLSGSLWRMQAAPVSTSGASPKTRPTVAKPNPARSLLASTTTAGQLQLRNPNGETIGLCPLQHTSVQADISGFVARVTVQQRFRNPSQTPAEAIYTFPLPDDAAVDGMTMQIGQRLVRGQIKRREEARQIYEAARNNGQAAALLDQERPNIFTQSVANLMPGADVVVSISYVNMLRYDAGQYEWVFPTVVGPRYTPTGGYSTPGQRGAPSNPARTPRDTKAVVTDAEKITPPIAPAGTRAGHDISIEVNVEAGVPLGEITSTLHPIDSERLSSTRARVSLRDQKTLPNKDFILRFKVAGQKLQTGAIAYAPSGDDGYFTLILQPPAAPPTEDIAPKEMIFVIDQTGSQSGWPIDKAKETIGYCLNRLNSGDTFQLIGFNTQVFPCFEKPVPASAANIAKAQQFLDPLVGRGGTDILKSVEYALQLPDDPARPRIVCYMTDGYVGNDKQIIDYIAQNRGRARMFPFGVGNSVNRYLINGMAREGRGEAEYVTLQEPGEVAAQKFYQRVANPLLLDVNVEWNGLPVKDVYPRHIPDVFTSQPIILKGRYTRAGEGEIVLSGLLRGKPWSQKIHVVLPAVQKASGEAMPTVWAREKMADLEAQEWQGIIGGEQKPDIKAQMVALALKYRLMSAYTSFVAVEERVVNIGGKQRTLDVPVEMPEGVSHDGIFGTSRSENGLRAVDRLKSRRLSPGATAIGGLAAISSLPTSGAVAPSANVTIGGKVTGSSSVTVGAVDIRKNALENRAPGLPRLTITPSIAHRTGTSSGLVDVRDESTLNADILQGTAAGQKRLAAMKPAEQRALLQKLKLEATLQGLSALVQKEGTQGSLFKAGRLEVVNGRVTIQIWLNQLPPGGLARLKAMGFELAATLTPNKLVLGTIPVNRLDQLITLPWIRRVEPPRFK